MVTMLHRQDTANQVSDWRLESSKSLHVRGTPHEKVEAREFCQIKITRDSPLAFVCEIDERRFESYFPPLLIRRNPITLRIWQVDDRTSACLVYRVLAEDDAVESISRFRLRWCFGEMMYGGERNLGQAYRRAAALDVTCIPAAMNAPG